jgi:alanine racemase
MGRLGVWYSEAEEFIQKIRKLSHLVIGGVYTHFPVADTNRAFTQKQIENFQHLVERLQAKGISIPYLHAANSMGLAAYPHHLFNLARPGIMLYGLYPSPKLRPKVILKPVLSVKSRIIFLKRVSRGRGISYGHTFIAPRPMTVATLPIGYSDGYLRCLSNKTQVLINGRRCPVVGRITMDQIMVDVTKLKQLKLGTEVTLLGRQNQEEISADELAQKAGTISYEIVCSLGTRLPKVYKK